MRLSTIKLAGFKSFVDPTTLHLPTNMTGIVGPNGCGKSNVIDAVRWVMGESAASRLRGDSLTDVIFSGSSARKPVGQASVELIFDNHDGQVGGEYAEYAEISVRRVVSRDGQSQYFLNGGRCRRRDITDLFLGTGLGSRSYSIIEQGMISDIVESHPEQLRHHLEEAAGITRYKERRKETETRIRHTRENIDRLNDIRDEVEKQLDHLGKQARAAERWQGLKDQQSLKSAELHALRYRRVHAELEQQSGGLRQAQVEIDKLLADQRGFEAQLEQRNGERQSARERLDAVQAESYRVGAEIARIEQQVRHNQELKQRLGQERNELDRNRGELAAQLQQDRARMDEAKGFLSGVGPELETARQKQRDTRQSLAAAETSLGEWQQRRDQLAEQIAGSAKEVEVERTRIDYLDRQSLELGKRKSQAEEEHGATNLDELDQAAGRLADDHARQQTEVESLGTQLEQRKAELEQLVDEERQTGQGLDSLRQELHTSRGRLASLEALQSAALGQDEGELGEWLMSAGLDPTRRLGSALDVDSRWETAVEVVLHGMLNGVLAEDTHDWCEMLAEAGEVDLALVDATPGQGGAGNSLAAHARGPAAALRLLGKVFCAESPAEALRRAQSLQDGESVICPGGEWFGPGFARILRARDRQSGVLAREREIEQLGKAVASLDLRIHSETEQHDDLRDKRKAAEQAREDAQRNTFQAHRRLSELAGEVEGHRGKLETRRARFRQLAIEMTELAANMAANEGQSRGARAGLESGVTRMAELEQQRKSLETERQGLLEQREEARFAAQESGDLTHKMELESETRRAAANSLEQSTSRISSQLEQLEARLKQVDAQLEQGGEPESALESERQLCLDQRLVADRDLVAARKQVEEIELGLRELEQQRLGQEQQVSALRESHAEQRLAEQALRMRQDQLVEAVTAAEQELETLLGSLPDDAKPETWDQELESIAQKIQRLEPVNLAAIQEHTEQAERKQYLDAQLDDLNSALETLEGAIRKIDRETRSRFKETFDKVNAGVQQFFPRLFGGGHAYLELTGEDLLDTGVAIMARPPGKRNSSISLLSGGEKALTAVALVFAIFQLNPAPFCILDEVDAPLDEANVGRFSSMVLEMSEKVQFIFVTHNKATMEAAHQLCGVTMREPGVSRLVQVDLAEASKLAGAA